MGNVQVAMLARALYTLLRDALFTHPTMSESLGMGLRRKGSLYVSRSGSE